MPESREKMAIIGAGPVGLGMAGRSSSPAFPDDQFEADDGIGGNWYHGVYSTTQTISSRNVTQFSEYPMPAHYPDYPSRDQVLAYLRDYARHFALEGHIAFNTKVVMARPRPDQLWDVTLASGETRTYKGLVVSNGHDWSRRYPRVSRRLCRRVHSFEGLQTAGAACRAPRAGDWRGQFGLRYRERGRTRRNEQRCEHAPRLLVRAQDTCSASRFTKPSRSRLQSGSTACCFGSC